MKRAILVLLLALLLESCTRTMTPYQATQKGGMKCGRGSLR